MHWNRKMRSIRGETDRHVLKELREYLQELKREEHWLAVQLFEAKGRPPDTLFDRRYCADCEQFYEPEFCAHCWCEAAANACMEIDPHG